MRDQRVTTALYDSQKDCDQGMTRCALSMTQNPNFSMKWWESTILLNSAVPILSGAQATMLNWPDIASVQRFQGGSSCEAAVIDS